MCAGLVCSRSVVTEHTVRRMAGLMQSWACTELGFRLIGIIRRMCSFGTCAKLIRGSLMVEKKILLCAVGEVA